MRIEITKNKDEYVALFKKALLDAEDYLPNHDIARDTKYYKISSIKRILKWLSLSTEGQIFLDDAELFALLPFER